MIRAVPGGVLRESAFRVARRMGGKKLIMSSSYVFRYRVSKGR
jgi:hypothetical protein